ncbi:hypothetical protein ACWD5R_31525 [Streptomyces sp. NPDC002514]|uniref:hypothetical protein n=1 Tax=Streptomyces sp. NPDC001270 TaxID=3364554 RepID=UPI00369DF623
MPDTGRRVGKRKQLRTASYIGALSDMRKHSLAENGSTTKAGETLRNLTIKGLGAAAQELRRPVTSMGSTACGAGSSGASRCMAASRRQPSRVGVLPPPRMVTALAW